VPVRRVKASHPDYRELSGLAHMIALAKNPHMFTGEMDILEPERRGLVVILEDELEKRLEGGAFADFLGGKEIRRRVE
jgi:hypothetical protein